MNILDEFKLSRGERFLEARTKYNVHGKQTTQEVSKATGVSASLINALENDDNNRSVGYDKIILLSKHYDITIDWLLGLSEDPKPQAITIDELGLSYDARSRIKTLSMRHRNLFYIFNKFTEHPQLRYLLEEIDKELQLVNSEIKYKSNIEESLNIKNIPSDNDIYHEITLKYPYLENRLYIQSGYAAAYNQREIIKSYFSMIADDLSGWNKLQDFQRDIWMSKDNSK